MPQKIASQEQKQMHICMCIYIIRKKQKREIDSVDHLKSKIDCQLIQYDSKTMLL